MREFSTKAKVDQIDLKVDGKPVFVRQLTAGDKIKLSDMQGELASVAANVRKSANSDDAEDLGIAAAGSLTSGQYKAWVKYMYEYVFLRWCNSDGKRKYLDKAKFNDLPSDLVEAIYSEAQKLDGEESAEDAEKNS